MGNVGHTIKEVAFSRAISSNFGKWEARKRVNIECSEWEGVRKGDMYEMIK